MMSSTAIVSVTLVNNWFRKSHGLVMGLVAATIGLSTAITSAIVPSFIQNYGWEKGFLLLGGMYAIALFAGAFLLIEKPADVGMLPYGVSEDSLAAEAEQATNDSSSVVIKHKNTDMTYSQALRSPVFYLLALSFVCFAMISTFTQQIPIFFTTKGATDIQAGMILSIASIVMIASKVVMGIVSDKLGATKAFYTFTAIYILAFCIFAATDNITILIGAAMIYAVSTGVPAVMNQLVTFEVLGKKEFTAIWGILSTASSLGLALGGPLLGYFYDATGSYNMTIIVSIVFMVVCLASFFFAVTLRKREIKKA
jgi:sugar phosphate permease